MRVHYSAIFLDKRKPNLNELFQEYQDAFIELRPGITPPNENELLTAFHQLKSGEGDNFFSRYGVGNALNVADRPFDRCGAYELLLEILATADGDQYIRIHKGTPYYFIGWTSLQMGHHKQAMFYLDAAVSEDLRFADVQGGKRVTPATDFFLLRPQSYQSGFYDHLNLRMVVVDELETSSVRLKSAIDAARFCDHFVKPMLFGSVEHRSILTALYSFILNKAALEKLISLRSSNSGSLQPFIDHLFEGARILESILAINGGRGDALKAKITSLPRLNIDPGTLFPQQTLKDAISKLKTLSEDGRGRHECAFAASYIIRNTTGHSLVWEDQFSNSGDFEILHNALIDSIAWSIHQLKF